MDSMNFINCITQSKSDSKIYIILSFCHRFVVGYYSNSILNHGLSL